MITNLYNLSVSQNTGYTVQHYYRVTGNGILQFLSEKNVSSTNKCTQLNTYSEDLKTLIWCFFYSKLNSLNITL